MRPLKSILLILLFVSLSMYIYAITNKVNGKVYVGQSSKELSVSENYYGSGIAIKGSIQKHGIHNFEKKIIVSDITSKPLLNELEKHYIQLYTSFIQGIGYNITMGGDGIFGYNHADETKAKIAKNHKCRQPGFVHPLIGISPPNKGIGKKIVFEGIEFTSHQSAADYYGIPLTTFNRVIDSGLSLNKYKRTRGHSWHKRKKILEVETGKIYCSTVEMGKQLKICQTYAAEIARKNKAYKGLTYKYV